MPFPFRRFRHALVPLCAVGALVLPGTALADTQPTATSFVVINGWNGSIGDVLTCQGSTWDGGNVTTSKAWLRDFTPVASGDTYTVSNADASHSLTCRETATNGAGSATSDSQTFGVTDAAPVVVTKPTVTGSPTVGSTVSCDGAVITGNNLSAPTYVWYDDNGKLLGSAQTYRLAAAQADGQVECRVDVSNGGGSVQAQSAHVNVDSGLAVNTKAPSISGKAYPGLTITCSPGTWTGAGITYGYGWLRNDKLVVGATQPTLRLTDADVDDVLVCRVTARNANGAAHRDSNGVVGFAPGITAPLARRQPTVPKLGVALATGIPATLVCNVTCATSSHAYIPMTLAKRLGLAPRGAVGAEFAIGVGVAHRTYAGNLQVLTKFSARTRAALAGQRSLRLNMLYETSYGKRYNYRVYHQASFNTLVLRR